MRVVPLTRSILVPCAFCACCGGCAAPDPAPIAPVSRSQLGPEVTISFPGGLPRYGDLIQVRLAVTNGALEPIAVRALELPGQLPERERWLERRSGRLTYDEARERFVWRPRSSGQTEEVFARGFLFPGETLAVERWLRVRGPVQDVVLLFQEVPAAAGAHLPSFEELAPARAEPRELYFREASVSLASAYRRGRPGSEERVVVLPHADALVIARRQFTVDVPWSEPEMPAAVLAELGAGAAELSAWDSGSAWLARHPEDGTLYVYPDAGEAESFSGVDFAVFDLVDLSVVEGFDLLVEVAGAPAPGSEGEAPAVERVEPSDFLELLRGVRDMGGRIEAARRDFGGERRELVLRLR